MAGPDLSGVVLDGRYQIVERLAEGAMGVVYRGVRTRLNRPVAVKVMHAALPDAMAARERFEREAKLMALLEHPHCVSVIDFGLHADKPYVVMELVRGRSLHEMLVEQGRIEIARAADLLRQVLSGLAHAHDQGIIHRDVKPANVMVTPKAPLGLHARILDFGLARMCGSATTSLSDGIAVGTPSYMAPEQCRGDQLDERVDLYACGVVLFEMVTGKKPFAADDPIAIIRKQLEQPPPRLADVAPGDYGALEDVVARALAKRPGERYPSAIAMSAAIEEAIGTRRASEATSSFRDEELGSGDLVAMPSSVQVPITVDPAALAPASTSDARTGVHDPHDASLLRRMLPVSRMRWVALAGLVAVGAASYAAYHYLLAAPEPAAAPPARVALAAAPPSAPPPPAPPVAHVPAATRAYDDGRAYFAKLWWNDGIKSFHEAIRLDPSYRGDPELLRAAVRGFATTPSYDDRLGAFLLYLGAPAAPYLDELAREAGNPEIRARAAAMARKLR
ncbi:MAG TPA: serine/threonine-protein kinase [Kofleriaceae bacterium]|nr:serine/threonine-protein kinase [Kofleriaceae bacterium]